MKSAVSKEDSVGLGKDFISAVMSATLSTVLKDTYFATRLSKFLKMTLITFWNEENRVSIVTCSKTLIPEKTGEHSHPGGGVPVLFGTVTGGVDGLVVPLAA